jgi:hypothetical protein
MAFTLSSPEAEGFFRDISRGQLIVDKVGVVVVRRDHQSWLWPSYSSSIKAVQV